MAELTFSSYESPTITPTFSPTKIDKPLGTVNVPPYVISVIVIVYIMYGVVLTRLRDPIDSILTFSLSRICSGLVLFAASITAELGFIIPIIQSKYKLAKVLGILILLARLLHIPGGYYITIKLIGSERQTKHYISLTEKDHLIINRIAYIPLFLSVFLDNTNVVYLPWLSTKFSDLSDGYPDQFVYTWFVSVKIAQSFIAVILQIVILAIVNTSSGFNALNTQTQVYACTTTTSTTTSTTTTSTTTTTTTTTTTKAYLSVSMISAMMTFLITLVGVVLQMRLLTNMNSTIDSDFFDVDNPLFRSSLRIGIIITIMTLSPPVPLPLSLSSSSSSSSQLHH